MGLLIHIFSDVLRYCRLGWNQSMPVDGARVDRWVTVDLSPLECDVTFSVENCAKLDVRRKIGCE